jgi:hypothetical protein
MPRARAGWQNMILGAMEKQNLRAGEAETMNRLLAPRQSIPRVLHHNNQGICN